MNKRELAEEFLNQITCTNHIKMDRCFSKIAQGDSFVLSYLYLNNKKAHPKEISNAMAVTSARIAKILRDLYCKGLITRAIDENDYRKIYIILTDSGEKYVEEIRNFAISKIEESFSALDEQDIKDLIRIRDKMTKSLSQTDIF